MGLLYDLARSEIHSLKEGNKSKGHLFLEKQHTYLIKRIRCFCIF